MTTQDNPFAARIATAALQGYLPAGRTYPRTQNAPVMYVAPAPATPRQIDFISALLADRNLSTEDRPKFARRVAMLAGDPRKVAELTRIEASAFITYLKELPVTAAKTPAAPAPVEMTEVPSGRYAVEVDGELMFVKVDHVQMGNWAGWTFVTRQISDDFARMRRGLQEQILSQIRQDGVAEASIRYGRELGVCGVCGRTLTNEDSRGQGIGPVCRNKNGW